MKHTGPALDVVVELELELNELVVLVVELLVADAAEMFTETGVLLISGPFVPVTLSVKVPTLAPWPAETVRVDVVAAFAGGVTGLGRVKVTPLGEVPCQETDNATGELKPSCESTVTTELPDDP